MADNLTTTVGTLASDDVGGVQYPRNKIGFGPDGSYADVTTSAPLPVTDAAVAAAIATLSAAIGSGSGGGTVGGATEATLAALSAKLPASVGAKGASSSLSIVPATSSDMATNAGIASALAAQSYYPTTQPVSGTVGVSGSVAVTGNFYQATQPVSIAAPVAVTGTFFQATQPISAVSLPLPSGAATDAKLEAVRALLAAPFSVTGTFFPATQPVSASALPLPAGASTETTLAAVLAKLPAAPATQATLAALLAVGTETYTLASNITLAAGAAGPTVTVPRGNYFFFDAFFTGTSPSVKLQRLGADGTTWIDVVTRTATGSGDPVGIPNGSQLRLYNAGAGSLTGVSAVLA